MGKKCAGSVGMSFVGALNLFFILWLATHLAHASRFRAQGGFGKYDGPPNRYLGPKSDENELPPDETESDGDVTKDLSDQPPSSMEKPRNRRPSPKSDENEAPPDKTESDGDVTKDLSDQPPPSMEKPRYGYDTREELSGSDFNSMDGPIPSPPPLRPGYPVPPVLDSFHTTTTITIRDVQGNGRGVSYRGRSRVRLLQWPGMYQTRTSASTIFKIQLSRRNGSL